MTLEAPGSTALSTWLSRATISAYEAGTKEPALSTLDRLAAAMGAAVVVELRQIPAPYDSMVGVASHLAQTAGRDGDKNYAIRVCADFLTWARGATPGQVAIAVAEPAGPTGDERFDALVAGVAEMACLAVEIAPPGWVCSRSESLRPWWFAVEQESLWPYLIAHTPAALAGRGVFVDAESLRSV